MGRAAANAAEAAVAAIVVERTKIELPSVSGADRKDMNGTLRASQ